MWFIRIKGSLCVCTRHDHMTLSSVHGNSEAGFSSQIDFSLTGDMLQLCLCVLPTWRHVLDGSSPHVHLSRVDGVVLQKKHFTCNTEVRGHFPCVFLRDFIWLSCRLLAINKYEAPQLPSKPLLRRRNGRSRMCLVDLEWFRCV